jgi:hypothetical protein
MPRHHKAVAWVLWHLWYSPAAAKLHNAPLPSVSASRSQAPLVAATASRPSGEGNRLYAKLPSLGAVAQPSTLPGRFSAPYAPPAGSLVIVVAPWHWSGAKRSAAGQWPAASQVVCAPPALWASPRFAGIGPCAGCPSAPKGLPHPSASVFVWRDLHCVRRHVSAKDMWPLRGHKNKSPEQVRALL